MQYFRNLSYNFLTTFFIAYTVFQILSKWSASNYSAPSCCFSEHTAPREALVSFILEYGVWFKLKVALIQQNMNKHYEKTLSLTITKLSCF